MTDETFTLPGAVKVRYNDTPQGALHLHVFHPEGHAQHDARPAIVFFFGGGWTGGTPAQFAPFCEHLAGKGMVAVSAEYRVKSRHGTSPRACVADGKSAVRYLRAHAVDMGIDPARLAAGGGSAGGHVAAATALLSHLEEDAVDTTVSAVPDALVLFNPVLDTTSTGWAGGPEALGEECESFSPVHHVAAGAPPTLVMTGEADTTTPVENARRFANVMREAGNRCELETYPDAGHGFFNKGRNDDHFPRTRDRMTDFLVSLGWI